MIKPSTGAGFRHHPQFFLSLPHEVSRNASVLCFTCPSPVAIVPWLQYQYIHVGICWWSFWFLSTHYIYIVHLLYMIICMHIESHNCLRYIYMYKYVCSHMYIYICRCRTIFISVCIYIHIFSYNMPADVSCPPCFRLRAQWQDRDAGVQHAVMLLGCGL
jgi:hypothetical protein